MATEQPTTTKTARVPAVGRHASCQVTAAMHDDLAVLLGAGWTITEVLRTGAALLADAHRRAWVYDMPDGARVEVIDARYRMADGQPETVPTLPAVTVP
ncbi:hypothetical protein N0X72_25395 [Streptomyces carpaticus]|uniref:hypothetical protein n=1 Tax=Streptomyces carpaticus TaxID=285558 RepID=UPI002203105E|nr:hypothetical protein N0X72_25395 [Streptomyces carpaticus]